MKLISIGIYIKCAVIISSFHGRENGLSTRLVRSHESQKKLLNNLMGAIREKQIVNIQFRFNKCGIISMNRDSVLNMLGT
jgi:hypothetical protein